MTPHLLLKKNQGTLHSICLYFIYDDGHRQHSKPIERKLPCIFPVFLETHPPQAARGRCGFIKIKIAETYAKI
jgi:hypothetical protein